MKQASESVLKRMLSLFNPYRGLFGTALFLTIILAVLSPLKPYLVKYVIDSILPQKNISAINFWMFIFLGLTVLSAIIQYAQTMLTNFLGQSVMNDLRKRVFQKILSLRLSFYDNTPVGTLQTRTISDIETLNAVFSQGFVTILGELLQLVAMLVVMAYTNWRLTCVVLLILPLLAWATQWFRVNIKAAFEQVRKYVGQLNAFTQEHLSGMAITQLFNREYIELNKFTAINQKHRQGNIQTIWYYSIFFPLIELISALAIALLVWYGTGSVLKNTVTFGELVAFQMYIQLFFRPIRLLADQFNTLQLGTVSAERIFSLLDIHDEISDTGKDNALIGGAIFSTPPSIVFDHVNFAYNSQNQVLHDVSFEVPAGKMIALVGTTGSGKSTIASLIPRFYDLNSGNIYIQGIRHTEIPLDELIRNIGFVQQDATLFSGTILDNITLRDKSIPLEKVQAIATLVGANQFIEQFPNGYFHSISERGHSLSSGQRQLIAFVRVLVYDPKILILDEATSNVDTDSEELIQRAISTLLSGRTAIVIAHRLSTIRQADKIIALRSGKIVESGSHAELIKFNGYYKRLYELQFQQIQA
ncbi:MAG: ABC transporter ATP-binding protein/permease [Bacteroidia bacterium]|nr:ABC transporter ATP-binding protein/permease [Bacteroidia bacterium]